MLRRAALAAVFLILVAIRTAAADTITATWDPNPPEEQVLGYFVSVGTVYGAYTEVYDVGNQTTFEYPNAVTEQDYFFAVTAYNAFGNGLRTEVVAFRETPPSLDKPADQKNSVGQAVALQLNGSDIDGAPLSYIASGLPPGLTLNNSTGLISGAGTTVGIYSVIVTVSDGELSTPQAFVWFIDGAPPTVTITSPTTQPTYSASGATLALGGSADDDLGLAGVSWANDRGGAGTASGTTTWTVPAVPLKVGNNVITITAQDLVGNLATAVIAVASPGTPAPTVAIALPTSAPTYSTTSSPILLGGTAGDSVGVTSVTWVSDRGGSGTATINTSLPPTSTSWQVPAVSLLHGINIITVTAWNASANSSTATIAVTLNRPPTFLNPPGDRTNAEGDVVSLQLQGNDADGDPITYSAAGLPPGLTLNQSSGLISGTLPYTASAVYPIMLGVSDTQSTTYASFVWTITNTNRPPVVANPGTLRSFQGVSVTAAITAVDPDGESPTFSAANLPPGLAISPSGPSAGVVSGTPTTLGTFTVIVTASDGQATGQATFQWTVASPLPTPASPVSPSGSIATTTPSFSWTGDGSATYYALSVSDAGAGSPTVAWYTPAGAGCPLGGTCTVASPRSLTSGLVTWAVITWNPFGYGPWSANANAVLDIADPSVPTPAPLAPSGPIGTRTPTFMWNAISNASWYQLSDMDALGTVREYWYSPSQVCASTPCAVTPNVLLAIGPAQWKLRAWRTSGAGAWTASFAFDATDSAPGTATLVSPLSPVTTVTPTFTWDAVLGTSYYLLRVIDRDNITYDRWYLPPAVACPVGTGICTASPGIPLKAGAASWMVLTWNGSGYGPWSATRQFLVQIADPAALVPAAVGPTGAIVSANVPYRWTAVAGALSYRLSIQNNGGEPTYWWFTPAAAGCDTTPDCSAVPQTALLNGTAQWQVQVWTPSGYGPWSPPIALTVNIPAPPAPTLVSPDGAAGGSSPLFRWNASANATLYYIRANDQVGVRVDKWLTPSQVGCASGGVCTLNAGVTLASGAGSWQVIAWNPTGYSPWSSTLTFVVP